MHMYEDSYQGDKLNDTKPSKAKFQGGSKTGGPLKGGKVGVVQVFPRSVGTPRDKGVNK